jgi:hypothetical protein
VDRVVREQDRDVQPRLLDGDVLEVVDLVRFDEAEHAADAVPRVRVRDLAVRQQLDLLQLLVDRHLLQQTVDLGLDAAVRRTPCGSQRLLVAGAGTGQYAARQDRAEHHDRGHDRGHPLTAHSSCLDPLAAGTPTPPA